MSKMNWGSASSRSRATRNGTESIFDHGIPGGLMPPRMRQSKAALQAEIDAAMARASRSISCACGHSATITIPAAKRHASLRCSKCGETAK